MVKAIGIISGNYRSDLLWEMFRDRPMAAVPFAGRYKFVDFALSSMVNSGIRTVGIIMPYCYRPVLKHLGAGKEWNLDRKSGGMHILSGLRNIRYLDGARGDYVIISGCNNIFNIDYTPALAEHEEKTADITMFYKEIDVSPKEDRDGVLIKTGRGSRVIEVKEFQSKENISGMVFSDILIIDRKLLLYIIKRNECMEYRDLLDFLAGNLKSFKVHSYPVKGYFGRVYSIQSYYRRSMEMLQLSVRNELFMGVNRVYTKVRDNPPTIYGPQGVVRDSLVSSGCHIYGNIEKSIIFRGVQVKLGATIKNSIVLQKCVIGKGAVLENAILDKYVKIDDKSVVKGNCGSPLILNKCSVI